MNTYILIGGIIAIVLFLFLLTKRGSIINEYEELQKQIEQEDVTISEEEIQKRKSLEEAYEYVTKPLFWTWFIIKLLLGVHYVLVIGYYVVGIAISVNSKYAKNKIFKLYFWLPTIVIFLILLLVFEIYKYNVLG